MRRRCNAMRVGLRLRIRSSTAVIEECSLESSQPRQVFEVDVFNGRGRPVHGSGRPTVTLAFADVLPSDKQIVPDDRR